MFNVLVKADHKFSLVCLQNVKCTQGMLGSLMEIGSVLHVIKVYCYENVLEKE